MKSTYRVLAYALAVEVVVQAMAIAYGIAGLGKWVDDGHGHALTKKVADDGHFPGVGGFAIHGINGELIVPVLTLALLIVSFFAKVPSGRKRAGILFGLVVLQVILGMALHGVPGIAPLHVLNAFGILVMAIFAGYAAGKAAPVPGPAQPDTSAV